MTTVSENYLRQFYSILQINLSKSSHLIRSSTLRLLQQLSEKLDSSSSLVEALLEIENTPRTVENIRSTSVAMRRLPLLFSKDHDVMLIAFCFGLLTVNFAPLWNDACSVLKAIVERSGAAIWEAAFSRLTKEETSTNTNDESGTEEPADVSPVSGSPTDELWNNCQRGCYHQLQS
jgi:U3 small nucleolar RNA-associated protein 20